jgi:drug/metabolite transporter (DMT)-like permease
VTTRHRIDWVRGSVYGIASAALFGLSAPLSKRLLSDTGPVLLAGLLYLGAGLGLTAVSLVRRRPWPNFSRRDSYRLGVIALVGGFVAPVLLLVGLQRVSGVAGSLLLNLETVFTMVLAAVFFRDRLSAREWVGVPLILSGAVLIQYGPGDLVADRLGVAAIAAACLGWGLDNNFTQRISSHDPVSIVQVKALTAGAGNILLATMVGQRALNWRVLAICVVVGFLCYGVSIVFDVYALRHLGAAREAAIFATAPFLGAVAAVPILGERLTRTHVTSATLMAVGVLILRYGGQLTPQESV